jgi:GT2 family glycosyltransferase
VKLSIIIVNYRAWDHIARALEQLQDDIPPDWEIIIVDNESEPESFRDFAGRFPWVKMIANPVNSGFGHGCVIGVKQTSGSQLLFMNPDVQASVEQLRALMTEKRDHPDVALLAPGQIDLNGRPQKVFDEFPDVLNQSKSLKYLRNAILPGRKPDPRGDYSDLLYCDWVTGSVLLIDRAHYDAIGGWSSDYWMYVEDADLCKKAHDAGLRVAYTPTVQVIHAHGGSSRINVDVKTMTKLEVIISKHVYVDKHLGGLQRRLAHVMISGLRLPGLLLATVVDVLTFRRIPVLRVRARMLTGLLRYHRGVSKNGTWLSPRALQNQDSSA